MSKEIATVINEGNITPVRLHLELVDRYLADDQQRMMKRYGESITGYTIERDILIPSDMPLHNLHYAIQKLFGWQNSHLRRFYLPEDLFQKLTGNTVKGWADLVGILFQPPSEAERDLFWDEDYSKGSFAAWLKKKYTGPYRYGGTIEKEAIAKGDMANLLAYFPMVDVKEAFNDFWERTKNDENAEMKTLRRAPLIDLTIEEMNSSIHLESGTESLLERLEVNQVLAAEGEALQSRGVFPVTRQLLYDYDFGDGWLIEITKLPNCDDLLEQNLLGAAELEEAAHLVLSAHKPVCLHKAGLPVLDDVGGLGGYADMLAVIYEGEDKAEIGDLKEWAKGHGWSDKKVANKRLL